MTYASDDLTPELVPASRFQQGGFAQGTLLEWDSTTYANAVQIGEGGAVVDNLHVLEQAANTIGVGDEVLLMRWQPGGRGRSAVYWIFGRVLLAPDLPPGVE